MEFNTFLTKISEIKKRELGGLEAQLKMVPIGRKKLELSKIIAKDPKEAAVLALFYEGENGATHFLLTKRASYKGTHSAQISFPGGKKNKEDDSFEQTALREANEEVNVRLEDITIIRPLSNTYIPPSNFWVYPFLGYVDKKQDFIKNYEVEELIEVPLSELLSEDNLSSQILETSYMKRVEVPCFTFNDHIIWGATAMILNEVKGLFSDL